MVKIGVLALQGAVTAHVDLLRALGAAPVEVRTPGQLDDVDALVLPGGESTTMSRLLAIQELFDPISARLDEGMPALGTCAGMILLAGTVLDGRADQRSFGAIDIVVRRNAFGRQIDSFERDLQVVGITDPDRPLHAVFIRAPFIESVADGVDVLASVAGHPVCARQGGVLVTAFHPELSGDARIHESFLELIG
jgi:5'-phosphate synthase pdxT subunit